MTTLSEQIAGERRRLKSVRQLFTTAVARKAGGNQSFLPFYIALGDYMEASMDRLHAHTTRANKSTDKTQTIVPVFLGRHG